MYSQEEILELVDQEKPSCIRVHDTNLYQPIKVLVPQSYFSFSEETGNIIAYSFDLAKAFVQDSLDLRIGELKWKFKKKSKYGGFCFTSNNENVYSLAYKTGGQYYYGVPIFNVYFAYRFFGTNEWQEVK